MNSSRLEKLLQFMESEPDEPFNIYAVATEYRNTDPVQSKKYFDLLLNEHPDYLPTYYHAALLYQELDEIDTAKDIFKKGIALAQRKNNSLTLRELQSAYDELLFEE